MHSEQHGIMPALGMPNLTRTSHKTANISKLGNNKEAQFHSLAPLMPQEQQIEPWTPNHRHQQCTLQQGSFTSSLQRHTVGHIWGEKTGDANIGGFYDAGPLGAVQCPVKTMEGLSSTSVGFGRVTCSAFPSKVRGKMS